MNARCMTLLSKLKALLNDTKVWKRKVHQELLKLPIPTLELSRIVNGCQNPSDWQRHSLEDNTEILSQFESHENGLLK